MSLSKNKKLVEVAKRLSRDLRRNQTNAEKIFWEKVRNRKFLNKKFYRQYQLFFDLEGKETFFIADFYCHEERLVVELDGMVHDYQVEYDKKREHVINDLGIRVLRFKNEEIENEIGPVLEKLTKFFNG